MLNIENIPDSYTDLEKKDLLNSIVDDFMTMNFKRSTLTKEKLKNEIDYAFQLCGIHHRLIHLYLQNKSFKEMTKDKTIIKYVYRQYHYRYTKNKTVRKILSNPKNFEEELKKLFKYISQNIVNWTPEKSKNPWVKRLKTRLHRIKEMCRISSHLNDCQPSGEFKLENYINFKFETPFSFYYKSYKPSWLDDVTKDYSLDKSYCLR